MNDFIQEEVVDYSFAPPDRRFDDSPFFLPDFNGKEDRVEDILFMIDTSGSMSDDMIAAAYVRQIAGKYYHIIRWICPLSSGKACRRYSGALVIKQ